MGTKIAAGTAVGFVVMMILGFLIWGLLLSGAMAEAMEAAGDCVLEPSMLLISLATLLLALLMTLILNGLRVTTAKGGLIAGAWISLLIAIYLAIWWAATSPFYTTEMIATDLGGSLVQGALGGAAIGWVLGKFNRPA